MSGGATPYRTPECGYSTLSSTRLKELGKKKGDEQTKEERERQQEINKAKAILLELEKDYLVRIILSNYYCTSFKHFGLKIFNLHFSLLLLRPIVWFLMGWRGSENK